MIKVPMREALAEFNEAREKTQKMKKVDWNRVEKCGWGMVGFCSSVRSTPFTVPNPQENKKKRNGLEIISLWRPIVESQENRTRN